MAGLAVAVPELPGVASIVAPFDVGVLFEAGSAAALADALTELADQPDRVAAAKKRARAVALERLNAESQRPALEPAWSG